MSVLSHRRARVSAKQSGEGVFDHGDAAAVAQICFEEVHLSFSYNCYALIAALVVIACVTIVATLGTYYGKVNAALTTAA
jgi:hypothetical protein